MFYQKPDLKKIEALQERLTDVFEHSEEENKLPASLNGRIKFSDYKKILDYFKEYNFNKIKKIPKRFDKKRTNLPRTLNLEFDYVTKEYSLFLETKSKQDSNEKVKQPNLFGANKRGKFSFRLDQQDNDYINLTFYHYRKDEIFQQMIENEIQIPRIIFDHAKNNGISENDIPIIVPSHSSVQKKSKLHHGTVFSHRISFHAPMALADLISLLTNQDWDKKYIINLTYQTLKIYETVYNAGIIYQDYKPDNILVFKIAEGQFQLKLTDFGFALKASSSQNHVARTTMFYASPEIASYNSLCRGDVSPYAFSQASFYDSRNQILKYPHWGNDAWAIASTIYGIYFGRFPLDSSPMCWLQKLFSTDRNKRSTPSEALDDFSKYYHVNYKRKKIKPLVNQNIDQNNNNLNNLDDQSCEKPNCSLP